MFPEDLGPCPSSHAGLGKLRLRPVFANCSVQQRNCAAQCYVIILAESAARLAVRWRTNKRDVTFIEC